MRRQLHISLCFIISIRIVMWLVSFICVYTYFMRQDYHTDICKYKTEGTFKLYEIHICTTNTTPKTMLSFYLENMIKQRIVYGQMIFTFFFSQINFLNKKKQNLSQKLNKIQGQSRKHFQQSFKKLDPLCCSAGPWQCVCWCLQTVATW